MEINRNNINKIITNASLKPDKDYGQNFLLEPLICQKIVDALSINQDDSILEIGPGLGSLTHFLSLYENNQKTIVDIDSRMIDFLKVIYQKTNINFILNDIRKVDVSTYTKIIGNLPYNITTELVTYLLKNAVHATKIVLMCQQEAFNRFFDLEGKEYGPVSILVHLLGSSKKLFSVKAGCFYPVPKCGSLVFEITFDGGIDRKTALETYELSKKLFLNRRKTIYNNLSAYLNDKDKAMNVLNELNIGSNLRPEQIKPKQFLKINQLIKSI